jgi:hypothetical protein
VSFDTCLADTRLDGILHKEWRSRLISQVDYNINELLADLMQSVTVHPGDVGFSCIRDSEIDSAY